MNFSKLKFENPLNTGNKGAAGTEPLLREEDKGGGSAPQQSDTAHAPLTQGNPRAMKVQGKGEAKVAQARPVYNQGPARNQTGSVSQKKALQMPGMCE